MPKALDFNWMSMELLDDPTWIIRFSEREEAVNLAAGHGRFTMSKEGSGRIEFWTVESTIEKLSIYSDEQLRVVLMKRPVLAEVIGQVLKRS